jgi:aspartate racemase
MQGMRTSETSLKTIGLIGGMSWESTSVYYQQINRSVREHLGGLHSARLLVHSCDFAEIVALQQQGRWDVLAEMLSDAARALERAGSGCVAICTNTMHKVASEVQASVGIPLLDIRDATGVAIRQAGMRKVGLLGTRYTMEQAFFRDHLCGHYDIDCLTPSEHLLDVVHGFVFAELCRGIVRDESRSELVAVVNQLAERGAEGIILGCTELMLLLEQKDCPLPLFDTTTLHSEALVDFAMRGD